MKAPVHFAACAFSVVAMALPSLSLADTAATIRCTGRAAPSPSAVNVAMARIGAEKAAIRDAQRTLLEKLKDAHIEGLNDPGAAAKVLGVIKKCTVVDRRYYADGGVDVDVELSLSAVAAELMSDKTAPASVSTVDVKKATVPNASGGKAPNVVQ